VWTRIQTFRAICASADWHYLPLAPPRAHLTATNPPFFRSRALPEAVGRTTVLERLIVRIDAGVAEAQRRTFNGLIVACAEVGRAFDLWTQDALGHELFT